MAEAKINSKDYWDSRFASGGWEEVGGRSQTRYFAEAQSRYFRLPRSFGETILDFGCGLGDALPIYHERFPQARLSGVDFSPSAIESGRARYGEFAEFVCGDHLSCPEAEIIVCSNVLEHLENDEEVARTLLSKCRRLYVTVPYDEQFLIDEHLRRYDKNSFRSLRPLRMHVFACRGWSEYGARSVGWEIYAKNLLRPLFNRQKLRRRRQILFEFERGS